MAQIEKIDLCNPEAVDSYAIAEKINEVIDEMNERDEESKK